MESTANNNVATSTLSESKRRFVPEDKESLRRTIKIIQQTSPKDGGKKGPSVILRSVDLNDAIAIARRCDEGKKPLFERGDIEVNAVADHGSTDVVIFKHQNESNSPRRHQGDVKKRSHTALRTGIDKFKTRATHEEPCCSKPSKTIIDDNKRKDFKSELKIHEKVPYFSDPVREKDRIRRLYGSPSRRRSRSRTPERSRRRSSARTRRLDYSPRHRRSASRNRHRSYSPYPYLVAGRDDRDKKSRRRSRTRSPKYDRSSHKSSGKTSREMERDKNDHERDMRSESNRVLPSTPYIPVPVAIADYIYAFPPWHAPPHIWGPHPQHRPPPSHYGHYQPFVPMMPTMRPPHQVAYGGPSPVMPYAPVPPALYRPRSAYRYPAPRQNANNSQSRYKKPSS